MSNHNSDRIPSSLSKRKRSSRIKPTIILLCQPRSLRGSFLMPVPSTAGRVQYHGRRRILSYPSPYPWDEVLHGIWCTTGYFYESPDGMQHSSLSYAWSLFSEADCKPRHGSQRRLGILFPGHRLSGLAYVPGGRPCSLL